MLQIVLTLVLLQTAACELSIGIITDTVYWNTSVQNEATIADINSKIDFKIIYLDHVDQDVYLITSQVCSLLANGSFGIVSYTECSTAEVMEFLASQQKIPYISFIESDCIYQRQHTWSIKLETDCTERNKILVALVKAKEWHVVAVLIDNTTNPMCITDFIDGITVMGSSVHVVTLNASTLLSNNSDKIPLEMKHLIVYMDDRNVPKVIEKALSQNMFSADYYWILNLHRISLLEINDIKFYNGFVASVAPVTSSELSQSVCAHQTSSHHKEIESAYFYDSLLMFNATIETTLVNGSLTTSTAIDCDFHTMFSFGNIIQESLNQSSIRSHSSKINMDKYGDVMNNFEICSVVNDTNKENTFQRVATYSTISKQFVTLDERLFLNEFKDFGNRTIIVTSVPATPFNVKNIINNDTFYYTGFCYDILDDFAKAFNFRYETVESIDGTYGGPTHDGTDATGMVGMVMRGEADIGIAPFTITATRDTVIDFLMPFKEEGVGIIMKKADPNSNRMFKMFLPFQYSVWLMIFATVAVIGILQYFVHRISPFNRNRRTLFETLWMVYGSFVGQGSESNPTFPSARVILGIFWLFNIVVLSLYTANLAAFLTVNLAKTPLKNIYELSQQTEYQPLVKEGTNLISLFRNAETGTYASIWRHMNTMPVVKTSQEAYKLVQTGQYAFMTDVSQLQYRVLTDCELEIADETFNKAGLSFIVREKAPFQTAFNKHMSRMLESGVIAKYYSNWWPTNSVCNEASYTTTATSLDLESIAGLFFVYCGMIGFSIICVVLEILFNKYFRKVQARLNSKQKVSDSQQDLKEQIVSAF